MPTKVILKKQRREVKGVVYKPGESCVIPDDNLADALAFHDLCAFATDDVKPTVDEEATAAAVERGKKAKAARAKTHEPKAAMPSKKKADPK